MDYIKIGNKYIDDFGIVTKFSISPAKRKEVKQDIPGRNGKLDYSEALTGFPTFENRTIKLELSVIDSDIAHCRTKINALKNYIHGVNLDVVFPDDSDFYYSGVWAVDEDRKNPSCIDVTLTCDAFPYRRRLKDTVITKTLSTSETTIKCNNLREPVVPTFETTGNATIKFGTLSKTVGTGKHTLDIVFKAGENIVKASGTGTLKIIYREGGL